MPSEVAWIGCQGVKVNCSDITAVSFILPQSGVHVVLSTLLTSKHFAGKRRRWRIRNFKVTV